MREVQAENVAYAVSAALGLDTSGYSFGYVASWAIGKTDEEMRDCLQVVRDAAKAMVEDLQAAMAARGCGVGVEPQCPGEYAVLTPYAPPAQTRSTTHITTQHLTLESDGWKG
jgi:hypothetical protein